jgi:replicative DNA helicase
VPTAIGARPGVGKSLTLWNFANAAVQRGEHVIIFTNEDNVDRTYKLGLAHHSGVERRKLESTGLTDAQKASIIEAIAITAEANSRFHFVKVHGKKMAEICRMAKALIRKYKPTIIALDYIQNVPNPEQGMNRNYGIEENLTMYDALIAEEEIVGIIVGQLKRMEPGAIPTMSDFKDSGSIEQKAKLMLTFSDVLSQNGGEHYPGEANFRIGVAKNSEGLSDFDVDCVVDKGLGRFSPARKPSAFQGMGDF